MYIKIQYANITTLKSLRVFFIQILMTVKEELTQIHKIFSFLTKDQIKN